MPIKIITTEDGSHSLYHEELNETYHSTRGARGESTHVFIKAGLEYWMSSKQAEKIRMLEIGLGTGLNAFLTGLFAEVNQQHIHFTTLEPYPISPEIYQNLNYAQSAKEKELLHQIHDCAWESDQALRPYFTLHKSTQKLENFVGKDAFDIIYFDAFAPSKQPEVWSAENLGKCYQLLTTGGVLTTYCAQGQFKRTLVSAGFEVETLQGAMGKKEMVRGIKK